MIHSPTCEHALRALIHLAERDGLGPTHARDIAHEAGAPQQTLAKILHQLRIQGLVRSTKGPGGGYQLARPPEQIRLIHIVEAVDGVIKMEGVCILGLSHCSDETGCPVHSHWKKFREEYVQALFSTNLRDAAESRRRKRELHEPEA